MLVPLPLGCEDHPPHLWLDMNADNEFQDSEERFNLDIVVPLADIVKWADIAQTTGAYWEPKYCVEGSHAGDFSYATVFSYTKLAR